MVDRLASALRAGRIGGLVLIFSLALLASAPAFAQTTPTLKTLYSFDFYPNGANPQGNLVADSNGNLFGTTSNGGYNYAGTAFEIVKSQCTSSGCPITTLFSFNYSDGAYPAAGLILDANGNLYGTTTQGGYDGNLPCYYSYGCGTVFELPYVGTGVSGNVNGYASSPTTLAEFNSNDGNDPIAGLALDAKGNLLGTTYFGGNSSSCYSYFGCGTAFEIVNNGSVSSPSYSSTPTTLWSFTIGNDGGETQAGLLVDGAGNLLGTTTAGGGAYGTAFEIANNGSVSDPSYSTATPTTLASFSGGSNGASPQAGLIADSNGNLFGTTAGNYSSDGTVFEIVNNGTASNPSYATTPTTLYSFTGTNGDGAHPEASLIIDGKGDLFGTTYAGGSTAGPCSYYSDGCGTIFEIVNNGTVSDPSYASTPTILYTFTDDSNGTNPEGGLIADASGNLYGTTEGGYIAQGTVFELTNSGFVPLASPLQFEYAKLKIISGTTPGFDLQTAFETTGSSFDPETQPVTLTVGSYTVTIPADSFHPLPNGRYAGAWVFSGVIDNVTVSVQIDPLGGGVYEFKANASPVSLPAGLTTINVSIQVGINAGSIAVTPSY